MASHDDADFEKAVAGHLRNGLHTLRGLSAEAYTALCRTAWDGCQSSPSFPHKTLIDPLTPEDRLFADSHQEYVQWRAGDELALQRGASTEIRCVAMGLVKPDLSTGPDDKPAPPSEEPETPETRRYLLAAFDVLGFSALLKTRGLDQITSLYARLIDEAVTKEAMRSFSIIQVSKTQRGSIWGVLPVRHAHFSDTILLWVPLVQHFIAPFLARCADMVSEALQMGLPLRGAITAGRAVMHARTGTYIGEPLVEAARLEQAQNWLGVSLGLSMLAHDISREFDPNLVVTYRVPLKPGSAGPSADLALDWPKRFSTRFGADPIDAITAIDVSPAHHVYYANALKFAEHSAGPIFRTEGLQPLRLGELAEAAVQARQTEKPLSDHHVLVLKDLARAGKEGSAVANFLTALAVAEDLPDVPADLPAGLQRHLRELAQASDGSAKYVKLADCAIDAVSSHLCGTPLSSATNDILDELEAFSAAGKNVATFIRALAQGHKPDLPRHAPRGVRSFLKSALGWATGGEVPMGVFHRVAQDCLGARVNEVPLDATAVAALASFGALPAPWPGIAAFLRAIADGQTPPEPPGANPRLRDDVVRIARTAVAAGVQSPKTMHIIGVGFGDPATGVDLISLVRDLCALRRRAMPVPEGAEAAIQTFEAAAPERAALAQCLRSLTEQHPVFPETDSLPVALRLALLQIRAISEGGPIPLDPSLPALAAIRTRHGGGPIGDCMRLSFAAMSGAGKEWRTLAEYLWQLGQGGPAGPAPRMTDPNLAEAAEEARCLAETQVGGVRLMMRQAPQPPEGMAR